MKSGNKVLIIGSYQGIGNRLARLYLNNGDQVFATYSRLKPKGFTSKNICFLKLELNNQKKFIVFIKKLKKIKFDVALFVAAVDASSIRIRKKYCMWNNLSIVEFAKMLSINCFSHIKILEYMMKKKLLNTKAKMIFFSSLAGSIYNRGKLKHNKKGGDLIYRISKAALNVAVKNIAYDFSDTDYSIVAIHPGWVRTRSGGKNANLSISYASKKIFNLIQNLKVKDSGKFLNYNGITLKW
jgi:NAD(P)-dependent dehydrogenase (short-subunit alcohol dehydrogenase family)